jgi:hypothetical protein
MRPMRPPSGLFTGRYSRDALPYFHTVHHQFSHQSG